MVLALLLVGHLLIAQAPTFLGRADLRPRLPIVVGHHAVPAQPRGCRAGDSVHVSRDLFLPMLEVMLTVSFLRAA